MHGTHSKLKWAPGMQHTEDFNEDEVNQTRQQPLLRSNMQQAR